MGLFQRFDQKLSKEEKDLIKNWIVGGEFRTMGKKTTICLIELKNGFEIIGNSAPRKKEEFEKGSGEEMSLKRALKRAYDYVNWLNKG